MRALLAVLMIGAFTGCDTSHDGMDGRGMSGDDRTARAALAGFDRTVTAIDVAARSHHGDMSAASGAHRRAAEAEYRERLTEMMGRLDDADTELVGCMAPNDADQDGETTMMGPGVERMSDEIDRHDAAMAGSPDEGAARAEEARHKEAMRSLVGAMREHHEAMDRMMVGMCGMMDDVQAE